MISVLFDLIHFEYRTIYFLITLYSIVIILGHKHQNKQSDH